MSSTLKLPATLKGLCLNFTVDKFEEKFPVLCSPRLSEIKDEGEPSFNPFYKSAPLIKRIIIEELIRRERCSYEYLKVLLPKTSLRLICDEDSSYTVFNEETLKLIVKRCQDFECLHFHRDFGREEVEITNFNELIRDSILRLCNLKDINLYDCFLELETFNSISLSCTNLIELNLCHTNLTDEGLAILHGENSVIKESLRTLIIDDNVLSDQPIGRSLRDFRNLTYFLSDRTLLDTRNLFQRSPSKNRSENDHKFYTTIIKHKFYSNDEWYLNLEFQEWTIEAFPKVNHLIFISINENHISFINRVITSWKNITQLELNAEFRCKPDLFNLLKNGLESCDTSPSLTSLKLESFIDVDLIFLGSNFKSLEKLSLINNTCLDEEKDENELFENLLEVEIIAIEYNPLYADEILDQQMLVSNFNSVLKAKKLEKVFILNQWHFFSNDYLKNLIEGGHLQNLKELHIFRCPIRAECIIKVFTRGLPIEKIVLGLCNYLRFNVADRDAIGVNNFKAITLQNQIPYRLRWTTLNIPFTM